MSPSLKNAEGARAVGPRLDCQHPAYAPLLKGRAFRGPATLFGKPYGTHYEPVLAGGPVAAVLLVGTDLRPLLQSVGAALSAQRPFADARLLALNVEAGASRGLLLGGDEVARLEPRAVEAWKQQAAAAGPALFNAQASLLGARAPQPEAGVLARDQQQHWLVLAEAPQAKVMQGARLHICTLLAMAVLAASIVWTSRRMVGVGLAALELGIGHPAEGDLPQPLAHQGVDEVGRLTQAVEAMRARTVVVVHAVRRGSENVAMASQEIASGGRDVSDRTEQQVSALQQTSATMTQVSSTVRHTSNSARKADALAQGARGG